jgi:SAM-dependent methyltransferase
MAVTDKCFLGTENSREKPSFNELGIDLCRYRADEELFRKQQTELAKHFNNAPGPVVDLGCGRGAMLELLTSNGVTNYGVDSFPPALEVCRDKSLKTVDCDIFSHLTELEDSSLGGVFCSHVIEHLHPPEALQLIRESYRVLRSGGTLILVTPNPKNLLILSEVFWLDLTHVRFYPARLLDGILQQIGFSFVSCFEDKHTAYGRKLHKRLAAFVRHVWLWGFTNRGDVVAVARK